MKTPYSQVTAMSELKNLFCSRLASILFNLRRNVDLIIVRRILRYDLPIGFTYLQLGRDFINLFLFKYMPF